MKKMDIPENEIPEPLRNSVVAKSAKSSIGALQVRRMSGLVKNAALKVISQFEKNISGGKGDVAEKLSLVEGELGPAERELVRLLEDPSDRRSLAHLIAEAAASPVKVMDAYTKGCIRLGQVQAAILAHQHMPSYIKDLARHALDSEGICATCVGLGKVKRAAGDNADSRPCPACQGSGATLVSSKHKQWAMDRLLEVTRLKGAEGASNVNVAVGVKISAGGTNFMETMMKTADEILYPEKKSEVIDAEVVE